MRALGGHPYGKCARVMNMSIFLQDMPIEQLKKLGSALARHTGQEEGETIAHLVTRVSVQLQKGLSAMILNRIPSHAAPVDGGVQ